MVEVARGGVKGKHDLAPLISTGAHAKVTLPLPPAQIHLGHILGSLMEEYESGCGEDYNLGAMKKGVGWEGGGD